MVRGSSSYGLGGRTRTGCWRRSWRRCGHVGMPTFSAGEAAEHECRGPFGCCLFLYSHRSRVRAWERVQARAQARVAFCFGQTCFFPLW